MDEKKEAKTHGGATAVAATATKEAAKDVKVHKEDMFLFSTKERPSDWPAFLDRWKNYTGLVPGDDAWNPRKEFLKLGKEALTKRIKAAMAAGTVPAPDIPEIFSPQMIADIQVVYYDDPKAFVEAFNAHNNDDFRKNKAWSFGDQDYQYRLLHTVTVEEEVSDSLGAKAGKEFHWINHISNVVLRNPTFGQAANQSQIDIQTPTLFFRQHPATMTCQAVADCVFESSDDSRTYNLLRDAYLFRRSFGNVIPYVDAVAILSDSLIAVLEPNAGIKVDARERIHNADGVAMSYPGRDIYVLENMPVDASFVTRRREDIPVQDVLAIENVDVRRAVITRIGSEIFNLKLAEGPNVNVLNEEGDYKLLRIKITVAGGRMGGESTVDGYYLRMVNPSTGAIHVEGVGPECRTVKDAIKWRTGKPTEWNPSELT